MERAKTFSFVQQPISVSVIIERDNEELVLVRQSSSTSLWSIPCDSPCAGESLWEAAVRTAEAQTGLRVALKEQFFSYTVIKDRSDTPTINVVFIAKTNRETTPSKAERPASPFRIVRLPQFVATQEDIISDYLYWRRSGIRPSASRVLKVFNQRSRPLEGAALKAA